MQRRPEAKHCSSLCSQSEGDEYCGGQARAKIPTKLYPDALAMFATCSWPSLCEQSEGDEYCGGQARAENPTKSWPDALAMFATCSWPSLCEQSEGDEDCGKAEFLLKDVDKEFCKGFIAFLKTCTYNDGKKQLSTTTCRMFVNYFGSSLAKAVRDGLIEQNPFLLLEAKEKPQKRVAEREFLTIEEIKKVMNTPCRYELVKKAFLFSCFTGLRYSDMKAVNWSEIHKAADGKTEYIDHIQVKTKDRVTIPLSEETKKWMPKREEGIDNIFHNLTITSTTVEVVLKEWMKAAGITKHITYHQRRHTTASLAISAGADISAVKDVLGHGSITSTEVYAKVALEKKIEAVNLFNDMFD